MARVYGRPGSYLDRRALHQVETAICLFAAGMLAIGFIAGLALGLGLSWALLFVLPLVGLVGYGIWRGVARMEDYRRAIVRGADGEARTAFTLEALPDTFHVLHDIEDGRGNIDHIVVGPTGVFAIETKNWRGTVKADGNGELLANGRPTDKPHVRRFTASVMALKDWLRAAAGSEPFVHGVMVFPISYLEIPDGSTGSVDCVRLDQLAEHIERRRPGRDLPGPEVERIAEAVDRIRRVGKPRQSADSRAAPSPLVNRPP